MFFMPRSGLLKEKVVLEAVALVLPCLRTLKAKPCANG